MAFTTTGLSRRKLNGLAHRVSKDILNKPLQQAFVMIRREGMSIRVQSLDDEVFTHDNESDPLRINVVVVGGIVRKSFVG